jgi:predicted esterase
MRSRAFSLLLISFGCTMVASTGCSSDDSGGGAGTDPGPTPTATTQQSPQPAPTTTTPPVATVTPPVVKPTDDPGPAPAGCTLTKDKDGFFTRTTPKSDYVGFVPKAYAGKPTTLVVGIHGCGDSAYNFATWGTNPYDTRTTQTHIGISIGGEDGNCWDTSSTKDSDKVLAAIADVSTCLYVHQQKVVLAGYSSGGELAYKMGLTMSAKFAGILIEDSGLGSTQPSSASWKINVAHVTHDSDPDYTLADTQAAWAKLTAAGIPLQHTSVAGTHDGTSTDWAGWLLPKVSTWKAP